MIRKAFIMQVFADKHAEYEKRHRPVWARMEAMLKAHGVCNYSIFLDEKTSRLFGYVEIESEAKWNAIPQTPECREWWAYMQDVMEYNPDGTPWSQGLREVFHID